MEKYNFKDNSDLKNNTAENLFDDSDIQACSAHRLHRPDPGTATGRSRGGSI